MERNVLVWRAIIGVVAIGGLYEVVPLDIGVALEWMRQGAVVRPALTVLNDTGYGFTAYVCGAIAIAGVGVQSTKDPIVWWIGCVCAAIWANWIVLLVSGCLSVGGVRVWG